MKKRTYGFENLRVASPCHEDWHHMSGDERVRFCGACERPVYNLSSLSGPQIAALIRETEGVRTCVRFFRRKDGTMLTQDCPVGHQRARRKTVAMVAAAVTGIFGGIPLINKLMQSAPGPVMGMMELQPVGSPAESPELIMGEMIIPEELTVVGKVSTSQLAPEK